MKELAQCLRTPSPFRCDSECSTSRQTIIGWEFRTWGKYAISFLIGSKLSQLTIFLWFGEIIGCRWLLVDGWDGWYLDDGSSMRSTTASSISRSSSARVSASFCWPVLWASSSSCFMRTREDLEARDNRRMTIEINAGMTTGNEIYKTYYFKSDSVVKKHRGVADCSPGSMGTVSEGVYVGAVLEVISWARSVNGEVSEALVEENNLGWYTSTVRPYD